MSCQREGNLRHQWDMHIPGQVKIFLGGRKKLLCWWLLPWTQISSSWIIFFFLFFTFRILHSLDLALKAGKTRSWAFPAPLCSFLGVLVRTRWDHWHHPCPKKLYFQVVWFHRIQILKSTNRGLRTVALRSELVIKGRICFSDGRTHLKLYRQNYSFTDKNSPLL